VSEQFINGTSVELANRLNSCNGKYRVAQKSKPLPNDQKIVSNRINTCQQA